MKSAKEPSLDSQHPVGILVEEGLLPEEIDHIVNDPILGHLPEIIKEEESSQLRERESTRNIRIVKEETVLDQDKRNIKREDKADRVLRGNESDLYDQ